MTLDKPQHLILIHAFMYHTRFPELAFYMQSLLSTVLFLEKVFTLMVFPLPSPTWVLNFFRGEYFSD